MFWWQIWLSVISNVEMRILIFSPVDGEPDTRCHWVSTKLSLVYLRLHLPPSTLTNPTVRRQTDIFIQNNVSPGWPWAESGLSSVLTTGLYSSAKPYISLYFVFHEISPKTTKNSLKTLTVPGSSDIILKNISLVVSRLRHDVLTDWPVVVNGDHHLPTSHHGDGRPPHPPLGSSSSHTQTLSRHRSHLGLSFATFQWVVVVIVVVVVVVVVSF